MPAIDIRLDKLPDRVFKTVVDPEEAQLKDLLEKHEVVYRIIFLGGKWKASAYYYCEVAHETSDVAA